MKAEQLRGDWFRVEFDAEGKLVSCERVGDRETDNGLVFFVCAKDKPEAQRVAWGSLRAYRREKQRRYREDFAAKGLCSCGGNPLPGRKRCLVCKTRDDRSNAKKYGKPIPERVGVVPKRPGRPPKLRRPPGDDDVDDLKRAMRKREFGERLIVLEEVAVAWRNCNTNAEFAHWLANEIVKITGIVPDTYPEQSLIQSSLAGATF